ncbi:hypothetical protein Q3G72_014502 [Acer saccharum]|nr:hypothetical protein Q3G72_014502 [Acer saccharum]
MKVVVVIESEMVTDRAMEDEFLETSTMRKRKAFNLQSRNFASFNGRDELSIDQEAQISSSCSFLASVSLFFEAMIITKTSGVYEVGAGINNNIENSASRQGEGRGRIEECLVAVLRI